MRIKNSLILITVFLLTFVFHCYTLMTYPAPFVDEAFTASRVKDYLATGVPFGDLDRGVFDKIPGFGTKQFNLQLSLYSLPEYFGLKPSLLNLRIVNLFFASILLLACFYIAYKIDGLIFGSIAILIVAQSITFADASHTARVDIMASALGYSALALYLFNKNNKFFINFIVGLILVAAIALHLRASILGAVIIALFFYKFKFNLITNKGFYGLVFGIILGLVPHYYLHVYPLSKEYAAAYGSIMSVTRRPPLFDLDFYTIFNSIIDIFYVHFEIFVFVSLLVLLEIILLLFQKDKNSKCFLTIFFSGLLATILLVNQISTYNLIIFSPIVSIVLAHLVYRVLFTWKQTGIIAAALKTLCLGIIIFMTIFNVSKVLFADQNCVSEYKELQSWIKSQVKENEKVMGPETFWFGFQNGNYSTWNNLVFLKQLKPELSWEQVLVELAPDVLILNNLNLYFISDQPGKGAWYNSMRIPKTEFLTAVYKHGEEIARREGSCKKLSTNTILYRFSWKQ